MLCCVPFLDGTQALGACLFSQVRVLSFSDRSPSEAPYKLPDKNTYTRYCLSKTPAPCLRRLYTSSPTHLS
jgi:hypothetical protein